MRSHTQSVVIERNRRRITGCISYKPINSDLSVLIVCNKTGGTIKGDIKRRGKNQNMPLLTISDYRLLFSSYTSVSTVFPHALASMCLVITGNICFDRNINTLNKRWNRLWIHDTDPLFDVCDISSELIKVLDN